MPAHFGEIRPIGLTSVISHITSPAQPSEKLPRCMRCQSFAEPLLELYWHIGDTTTRLGSVSPRSVMGENRTLAIESLFDAEIRLPAAISRNAAGSIRRIPRLSAQAGPGGSYGWEKQGRDGVPGCAVLADTDLQRHLLRRAPVPCRQWVVADFRRHAHRQS